MASSEILTPHANRQASVYGAGGGPTRWVERGRGSIVRKTSESDTALYSVHVNIL
jgi:hypothetical protein